MIWKNMVLSERITNKSLSLIEKGDACMPKEQKVISRRNFLVGAGGVAGALALGKVTGLMDPKPAEAVVNPMPWPYEPLDVEIVRKRGFDAYFVGGCAYASAKGLIETLCETVGTPWDTFPVDMFKYGSGGALGWGTLCGSLNGSLGVMSLALGTNINKVGHQLMGWYTQEPFPSTLLDQYCDYPNQAQTVSHSPLCHNSVSIWTTTTEFGVNSIERKHRCAKVAGDTAAKAAQLMNEFYAGTFTPVFNYDEDTANCMGCHVGTDSTLNNAQGLMECLECHDHQHKMLQKSK